MTEHIQDKHRLARMAAAGQKAKSRVEKRAGDTTNRQWAKASPSQAVTETRVELHVLSGTPPAGYVLAEHSTGMVRAFDAGMRHITTFYAYCGKMPALAAQTIVQEEEDPQVLIRRKCAFWEQEHGKINDKNFIKCLAAVMSSCGSEGDTIEVATKIVFELGGIKHCSCCGRAPASEKEINGEQTELCIECQSLVIFQQLGPGEGYV